MLKHFLNPPNWFTAASIFCSVYAVTLVVGGDIRPEVMAQACILVIFAGVFDLLDGRVARLTNRFSDFGVQLDSLADLISFGVAPALIAYTWSLHKLGVAGAFIAFWWVLCAAFRLARFNVDANTREWALKGHSQGITSTMAGGSLVTIMWMLNGCLMGVVDVPPFIMGLFVSLLGLLMISSVPFRTFRDIRSNPRARVIFALGLSVTLAAAVIVDLSFWFGATAILYVGAGFIDGVVTAVHHRRSAHDPFTEEV